MLWSGCLITYQHERHRIVANRLKFVVQLEPRIVQLKTSWSKIFYSQITMSGILIKARKPGSIRPFHFLLKCILSYHHCGFSPKLARMITERTQKTHERNGRREWIIFPCNQIFAERILFVLACFSAYEQCSASNSTHKINYWISSWWMEIKLWAS